MRPLDRLLMNVTMTLTQASRAYISSANKVASGFDLSHATAWPILMISRLGDNVRPGMIAEALGLEAASLVRVIDQLVDAQLVDRHDDPNDRRAKILRLTATGQARAAQLEEALLPFRRNLFNNIPQSDIDACLRTLQAIKANTNPNS
jgi:MarR family transcriptional regulator for hemolysin